MLWWDLPFSITGSTLTCFQSFPLGKKFGFQGSNHSFRGIVKHLCSCCCHFASYTFSCMQDAQYPLFRGPSLMSVPLCWVRSGKCCDDRHVDNFIGFVNVGLLCNTLRVVSPMSRAAKVAAETVVTFGHDASNESPTVPHHPQSGIPSHEGSYHTYNSTQMSSNHSHNSSWSSVDSNTGLIGAEKASRKPIKTRVVPLGLHIVPPAELGRQLDSERGTTPPHSNTKKQYVDAQSAAIDSLFHTVNLSPCPPRVVCLKGDTRNEPWTENGKISLESTADTDIFGEVTKELSFKSKASLASNFPSLSVAPLPTSPLDATDKSAAFATRLGIPVALADNPSQARAVFSALPITLAPRLGANHWSPEDVGESHPRHFSTSSYGSTVRFSTDSESVYSGEIMHACKIRPHSRRPDDDEEDKYIVGSLPPDLLRHSAWCRRATMASVWSQDSARYTMCQFPDEESQEAYWQLIPDLLDPKVMSGEADAVEVMSRRVTFARPHTLHIQLIKALSKRSVHSRNSLNLKFPSSKLPTTISVPNDSVV